MLTPSGRRLPLDDEGSDVLELTEQGFYEVRGGYRSTDYPFSIIEIVFDQKGRGTGTFIGLAELKMKMDKKSEQWRLEIENFGSFPAKVMGVMRRN